MAASTIKSRKRRSWAARIALLGIIAIGGTLLFWYPLFGIYIPGLTELLEKIGWLHIDRGPSPNSLANSDVKNAYTYAQAYFMDHPNGSVDTDILSAYGFRQYENVVVIPNGTQGDLTIVTYHSSGDRTYTIHSDGYITND